MTTTDQETESAGALAIGELAASTGVSRRSLRHYEVHGLLTSQRADNGYRRFPENAVARVGQIQRFIAAGFSLREIQTFPECMLLLDGAVPCAETLALQRQRLALLDRQMEDLERRRLLLRVLLDEGEAAAARGE